MSSMSQRPQRSKHVLDAIEEQFALSDETLRAITKQFVDDFNQGLSRYNEPMAMIPSYVAAPDGSEKGSFLALDLGGTNLRVCEIHLKGDKTFTLRQHKYKVSDALKTGEASALFDYLADCVDMFMVDYTGDPSDDEDVKLGLTFSFPVEQTALDKGKILTWTKGFSVSDAVGQDVVKLLQDAFDRKHLHVKCVALVNDTVGTLLSRAYTSGGCFLGAIFGTGTNGAYVEDVANITKLDPNIAAQGRKMVVNSEWGAFDNKRRTLPFTQFDNKLDRESINPRFQAFEKFISGMYLGEITRNILLFLIDASPPILFSGFSTPQLNAHYGFDSALMSNIETSQTSGGIRKVLVDHLGFKPESISDEDTEIVRWACRMVATRAGKLSGTAVAAVLVQTGYARIGGDGSSDPRETLIIGVDGSLIEFYPEFEQRIRDSVRAIVGEEVERSIDIGLAKDGSGVGAALCAFQAMKGRLTA